MPADPCARSARAETPERRVRHARKVARTAGHPFNADAGFAARYQDAIDNCHRSPRGGGVQDGVAAEHSEGILDAAEHGDRVDVDGGSVSGPIQLVVTARAREERRPDHCGVTKRGAKGRRSSLARDPTDPRIVTPYGDLGA